MKTTKHLPAFFILFFYTILSLFRLGHPYAPSTSWEAEEKATPIFLDFGEEKDFSALVFYLGNYENRRFAVQVGSGSPIRWTDLGEITIRRVYQWSRFPLKARGRYLRLTTLNQYTEIREMLVKDGEGALILPVNKANYPRLFDESRMYPGYGSFLSGTVFDESVFARTAYEHLHGLRSYEDTHPPLGKLIISLGIAGFGMNPFGWRIAGVIAGSLLLLVVWAFGLRLFSDRRVSVGVLLLLAFDCLHFTESRLGQVDSFLVLFMTGMNYFMFRYYEVMVEGDGKKSWRFLLGSGLCMGLAASCKWSGLYGGLGLALIWFAVVLSRGKKGQMSQKEFLSTCGFCCLAFILLPIAVYLLSYIPYVAFDETMGFWERVLANQKNMLQYHLHVGSEHESASAWFQWLCSAKPVRLLTVHFSDGDMEGLVLMGNPAFWWTGIAVVFFCLYQMAEKAEGRLGFLLTAYAAPILPWMGISRYSFLYHYYPSIPFLALLIGYWAEKRGRWGKCCLGLCVLASAVCFCLFYPVISALRVPQGYVAGWLEWLPGWDFIS
ncbi:MAG: phospholipid carrier-dependent glycosyltransferase [Lachnospiraceae bacterium]|nr:phospholipid carrier-dependent glycosyltransferase [Lachnospiraceae bacterium]